VNDASLFITEAQADSQLLRPGVGNPVKPAPDKLPRSAQPAMSAMVVESLQCDML